MNADTLEIKRIIEPLNWNSLMEHIFFLSTMCTKEAARFSYGSNRPYPFVIESLYEYAMRMNVDGSSIATNEDIHKLSDIIFRNPKRVLDKYGMKHLMMLFYLWQIEDRHLLYMKLFRYNWFFSFKNEKVDMKAEFYKKYGCPYDSFAILCFLILTTVIALDEEKADRKSAIIPYINKVIGVFHNVAELLSVTKEDYIKESERYCSDLDMLTYSLKTSKKYPFVKNNDFIYLYMPHVIIPACTSSLLFRLTENNDKLYGLFGKEVLEEYYYALAKTQDAYSYVHKEIEYGTKKTPDLILIEGVRIFFVESKSFSPSFAIRIMNEEAIEKQIDEIVEGLTKLYKFIFINYPKTIEPLSSFGLENRYGVLSVRGEASFDRRIIYERLFASLNINDDQIKQTIIKHIKITCLDEYEDMIFTNTPISKLVDYYNVSGNEMHYTASSVFNKSIACQIMNDYKDYIEDLSERFLNFISMP